MNHMTPDDDRFIDAILADVDSDTRRLVYADFLDEWGHLGADYLRTEVALARATGDNAINLRRKLLEIIPHLPIRWRNRFEQPDLLLAPPVPFATGWYAERGEAPAVFRSLPNLNLDLLSPELPWLSAGGVGNPVYDPEYVANELASLKQVLQQAALRKLTLPLGFESFARDFPRRIMVSQGSCEVCLQTHWVRNLPHVDDFHQVEDGYLVIFFADMDYGNPHQLSWALYLVPGVDWHCVVVYELGDVEPFGAPDDPMLIYYCAPSFQAFLYRWWLTHGRRAR
jgi:uncharacterized protein (TIGR02996 family)